MSRTFVGRPAASLGRPGRWRAQRRTPESIAATIVTHAHVLTLPEPERTELPAAVVAYRRGVPDAVPGAFDLPMVTAVIRAVRR